MKRLTDKFWLNQDPWELCGLDKECSRTCVNENGEVCDVAVKKCRLARYEDIGSVEDFENAVDELRKRQWISVNDRLPENGKEVLCWYEYFRYGDYNHLFQTYGIGYQFNGHWSGEVAQGSQTRVIAWQPLPEPPKEG